MGNGRSNSDETLQEKMDDRQAIEHLRDICYSFILRSERAAQLCNFPLANPLAYGTVLGATHFATAQVKAF